MSPANDLILTLMKITIFFSIILQIQSVSDDCGGGAAKGGCSIYDGNRCFCKECMSMYKLKNSDKGDYCQFNESYYIPLFVVLLLMICLCVFVCCSDRCQRVCGKSIMGGCFPCCNGEGKCRHNPRCLKCKECLDRFLLCKPMYVQDERRVAE
jgi:hypothetical protein